ncbi:FAD binding domain-containing protein [Metarhizium album ARSEF 1941]|uniref:FAD binding domain-containing protein n=1 Tax=Metarhizium album (strain ARSEF 1941) TaxID=1081103 RepID=A0A0B2X9Y7_METAS|nr:FAD binding domain-containing protein [Metarhizium album ARSEF 1941]KHO02136.1 FAD binding domain-containing protein [Metarhizium album ARSEF 1941]
MVLLGKIAVSILLTSSTQASQAVETDGSYNNYNNNYSSCRCRAHENCWPSNDAWNALNSTIQGNLQAVRPVAAPCFKPSPVAASCAVAEQNANNSVWRSAQPGAVQWTNWEARPEKKQTCYFDQPKDIPCGQGRVSLYSALVETAEHIQAAVRFAAKYNIRLAIKNSGHCFLGRSTAPESLQISTYKMKSMSFTNSFVPDGAADNPSASHGPAVTFGAGVQLKELYVAAAKHNVTVVAGLSHTVGAAGGYIQGGGHSPLGNWKGMASDNALEFKVVNAKGELVTANNYKNKDLFWALRGGGGGTFGVVVSVTIRTFPDVPSGFASFGFGTLAANSSAYWDMVRAFHVHLPSISAAGGAGYYGISSVPRDINGTKVLELTGLFGFLDVTREQVIQTAVTPMMAELDRYAGPGSGYNISMYPRVSDFILGSLPGLADGTGGIAIVGSRMVSRDFLLSDSGPARLTDALRDITKLSPTGFTGHVVAGGAAADATIDSALNPAWRNTLTHVAFAVDWNSTTSAKEIKAIQEELTNVKVEKLRALEPQMGAYLNEADPNEKDFQKSFWGTNYAKLYDVKQAVDPDNLFIARKGVGSENWDDAGLCRRTTEMARQ